MAKFAFIDNGDGYYEVEADAVENLPGWTASLTAVAVRPPYLAPATKEQRIAHILATQGQGRDRTTIQLAIQVAELIATLQAPSYGMTPTQAIAYAYSKNFTYQRSKDAEAACRAVEVEP